MKALAVAAAAAATVLVGSGIAAAGGGLHGLVPQPLPRKPSFTLTDTAGRPFRFDAATTGKLTFLYFGYTHCPDACPTTMADLAAALHEQAPRIRRHIEVVFVTVDPRRDTRGVLRAWLNHFDRSFVGLTGSPAAIGVAERSAGMPVAPPAKAKGSHYSVAHSTFLLPFSPDDLAHVVYVQGFHTADYAHDIPLLLRYSH
jgi:protein SCO1/2